MKVLKWIAVSLCALTLIIALLLAYIVLGIDPNSYKPKLSELAEKQGISLDIEGELSWQFLPDIALSIGATHISSQHPEIPETRFQQASLSLAWLPLLKRQLSIKAIHIDGADIHLRTVKQGTTTIGSPLAAAQSDTTKNQSSDSASGFTLAIETLDITNSRLQLPVPATGSTKPQQLENIDLRVNHLNLDGTPFSIKASFTYSDPALPEPMAVTFNTQATVAQSARAITFRKVELNLQPKNRPAIELAMDTLSADESGHIDIPQLLLTSAGAKLQASLSAQTTDKELSFASDIALESSALRSVLTQWAIELPPLPDPKALQKASLKFHLKGSGKALSISDLALALDDIQIDAKAKLSLEAKRQIKLSLSGNTIDLNRYLDMADKTASNNSAGDPAAQNAVAMAIFAPLVAPLAWVGDGDADIDIRLAGVNVDNIKVEKIHVALKAENNIAQVKALSASVFDGAINATATINLSAKTPKLNFTANIDGLSVGKATAAFSDEVNLLGSLTAKIQGSSRGNTADALHSNLLGNGEITLAEPKITTFNIERTYCETAALIEKIPSKTDWSPGSTLQNLQASISLKGKQVLLDQYSTGLGNLSLKGQGLIDVGEERFNILAVTRLNGDTTSEQGCTVKSRRIRDKDIPIRCQDSFAKAGGNSCTPDGDFVRQIMQDEVLRNISKKTGLDKDSEEAVKGLLKGLFGR